MISFISRPTLSLLMSLAATQVIASEADNFTGRDRPLRDSLPVVDAKFNAWLDKTILEINRKPGCDRERLMNAVHAHIGGHILAALENWADDAKELDRYRPPFGQSIYADKPLLSGVFSRVLTTNIRLNGVYIGVDKLGHFFNQGQGYYKSARLHGEILDGLQRGEKLESGIFGLITTGVRSYADLSANYAGYRFWANLAEGDNPLVACENGQFRKTRPFTFKDYVDESWDEAINCSDFIPSIDRRVKAVLAKRGLKCPVDEDACRRIRTRPFADRLISPQCLKLDAGAGLEPASASRTAPLSVISPQPPTT